MGAVGDCEFFNNMGAVRLLRFKNETTAEDYGKLFPHVENEIMDNMWITFFPHVENSMWKTCYGGTVLGNNFVTLL